MMTILRRLQPNVACNVLISLLLACLTLLIFTSAALAQLPVVESAAKIAKTSEWSISQMLVFVLIFLCAMFAYLLHLLKIMMKKPCVYKAKDD